MMINALHGFGFSSTFTFNQIIVISTNNYNIKTAAVAAGWDQVTPLEAVITIYSGVIIGSTSVSIPALQTDTGIPTGSIINIINNGIIKGKGGMGAACRWVSASSGYWAYNGGLEAGGTALKITLPVNITNNGVIAGGGGGGAYIGGYTGDSSYGGAAGGGGAGVVVGESATLSVEYGGTIAVSDAGTSTTGGAGSLYTAVQGPSGGDLGQSGGSGTYYTYGGGSVGVDGGAAGKYIEGVAYATWTGTAGIGATS